MNKIFSIVALGLAVFVLGCGGSSAYVRLSANPMPEGGSFDGAYHSEVYGRMELNDNGGSVVGLYEGERHYGRIEGTVNGDLLSFSWTQWTEDLGGKARSTSGSGYFRYIIRNEGTSERERITHFLEGEWGYGDDNSGNTWNSVKFPEGTKKILSLDRSEGNEKPRKSDPFSSGGAPASASPSSPSAPAGSGDLSSDVDTLF